MTFYSCSGEGKEQINNSEKYQSTAKTRLFVNSKKDSNTWNSINRREIKIIGIP